MSKKIIYADDAIEAVHNLYAIFGIEGEWVDRKDVFEAINSLPSAHTDVPDKNAGDTTHKNVIYSPVQMAMDYAVNATDFSASSDTIYRQAAIDALAEYIHNINKVMGNGKLSAWDCADAARSVLGDLPSAQPQWISVTEAMPDEHNRVLILTDDGTIFIGDHNEYWEDDYEFEIDDVIAWMPLPEPYKGE